MTTTPRHIDMTYALPIERGERIVVRRLLNHLIANGFHIVGIWDGEAMERPTYIDAMLDVVFNLDESSIRVSRHTRSSPDWGKGVHGIFIVLGNAPDGSEVVSDWNYHHDDADGFNAVMDAFTSAID